MTSSAPCGRHRSGLHQKLLLAALAIAPLLLSAALATPVQPDEGEEMYDPMDRLLEYLGEREAEQQQESSTQKPPPSDGSDKPKQLDPWSLVWYIGSFGGLVAFFLAVSCSECCCHKPASSQSGNGANGSGAEDSAGLPAVAEGPPPPPYSMFAPPPYDSLCYGFTEEKDKLEVFVVPVPVHGATVTSQANQPP